MPQPKWEYQFINLDEYVYEIWEQTLTIQGGLGWELISVDGNKAYFKREVLDSQSVRIQDANTTVESEEIKLLKHIKAKLDRCL